jgi:Cu(I)/Ag(I) efflux system membrane fusion protein
MKYALLIPSLIVLAGVFGLGYLAGGAANQSNVNAGPSVPDGDEIQRPVAWTCSMHPQVRLPDQASCPICAMDLVPVTRNPSGNTNPRELSLSPEARKLAEILTMPVQRRFVDHDIRIAGKIVFDDSRMATMTVWYPANIERVFASYPGVRLKKGEPLAQLYSPLLLTAQMEYFQARKNLENADKGMLGRSRESALAAFESTRRRLLMWNLTEKDLSEIEKLGTPSGHRTLLAPMDGTVIQMSAVEGKYIHTGHEIFTLADLSEVSAILDAYESDLALMRVGQKVQLEAEAFPGEIFEGTITLIEPSLDELNHTVSLRVRVSNPEESLLPGMFVRAKVKGHWPHDGSISEPPLVIPASAPLVTGKRAVVYVAVAGRPGTYEGREIVLGPRTGDMYTVREGLEEGEEVVVRGNFKIDSALQILAAPSMMNPMEAGEGIVACPCCMDGGPCSCSH